MALAREAWLPPVGLLVKRRVPTGSNIQWRLAKPKPEPSEPSWPWRLVLRAKPAHSIRGGVAGPCSSLQEPCQEQHVSSHVPSPKSAWDPEMFPGPCAHAQLVGERIELSQQCPSSCVLVWLLRSRSVHQFRTSDLSFG